MSGLFQDSVTIREPTSRNSYGTPTYGPSVTYTARVERKPKQVRTLQGEERVSAVQVVLDPSQDLPRITPEAELTLADGATPTILSVAEAKDYRGNRRVELFA